MEPSKDIIAPIIIIKLKPLRVRQYVKKGKEIQDPILDRIDKYLNKPTITKKEQALAVKDQIKERNQYSKKPVI